MIAPGDVAVAAPPGRWHVVELEEEPELDGILDVAQFRWRLPRQRSSQGAVL